MSHYFYYENKEFPPFHWKKNDFILLDLSECDLTKVPDAVYMMLKSVTVHKCTMANNLLTKIPPKFPSNFKQLKGNLVFILSV